MNRDHKEDERRWAIEYFLPAWDGRAEIATIEAGESPDFRGKLVDDRQFGLEVVTVTDRGLAHGGSVLDDKLKPELEAAATAAGINASIALYFGEWQERPLADRTHRRKLITDLVEFARGAGGRVRQTANMSVVDGMDDGDAMDDLEAVDGVDNVIVQPSDDGVHVWIFRSAWGRGCNEIQGCIAAKDEKADDYRANLAPGAQLWLLVVAGTTYANGVAVPPRHLTYETKFDRLFFLDHWPVRSGKSIDKVVELRIRRSG